MTIYLYKKTHNKTGLQYLGKTVQNPFKYKGSGEHWVPHIKKHGYDVTTEVLRECQSNEEVKQWGRYYSELWNVVDERDENGRKTWANLKPEEGDGGRTVWGDSHPSKRSSFKQRMEEVWTEEKREQSSKLSHKIAEERPNEEKKLVSEKLKKTWANNPDRKKELSDRMREHNPVQNASVIEKIKNTKSEWSSEQKAEVVKKTSGPNHYRHDPNYKSTQVGEGHPNFNATLYTFFNENTQEIVTMTIFDFINAYNLHQGNVSLIVNGKRRSHKGWVVC